MKFKTIAVAITASLATAAGILGASAVIKPVDGIDLLALDDAPAPMQLAYNDAPEPQAVTIPKSQAEITQSFAPIVKQTAPAVVNVFSSKIVTQTNCPYSDPFWRAFYCGNNIQTREARQQNSLGSGVIVSSDGVIVTNNHVVEAGDEFKVVLNDRREFEAELVMKDARTDLAVLKIDLKGAQLPRLEYADTRSIEVGDLVMAIGNPFGVGQTVTTGIVSALARTDVGVSDFASFIQTDASINPGNSGGALVDMRGRLVGVNTMIFSRGGGSNGVGFAIPAEMVKRVVDAAVNGGTLVRPWLGAQGEGVTAQVALSLGMDRPRGVLLGDIYKGGPADKAGLKVGDVVVAVDGREVFDEKGMKFVAATKAAGENVAVRFVRNGREQNANVRMEAPPGTTELERKQVQGRNPFSGAVLVELSPALAEESGLDPFRFDSGMIVYSVPRGTMAARLGLRPNDIIQEVNGRVIRTAKDLEEAISSVDQGGGGVWNLAIERNGQRIETSVRV